MNHNRITSKAKREYFWSIILCLLTFVLIVFAIHSHFFLHGNTHRTRALFLEEGLLDFDRANVYPIDAGTEGMFGSLLDYLSALGYTTARTKGPFTDELLRSTDILFVINSTYAWSPEELERIHRWVQNGGALIVFGDHTDLAGMTKSLDPLLALFGGKLNFETGDSFKPLLKHGWKVQYHPIFFRVTSYTQIYWGTGGTLSISYPLLPFIEGLHAYGDVGDYSANSNFGNRKYDTGERAGDITLAAFAEIGNGKILVCADTSPFLNGTIHLSFYPFLYDLFSWIQSGPAFSGEKYFCWIAAFILILLFAYIWKLKRAIFLYASLIGLIIGVLVARNSSTNSFHLAQKKMPLAVFDLTHLPHYATDAFNDHSLDGAAGVFLRSEYMPIAMWNFDQSMIDAADVLVLQQPAIPYSSSEKDEIYDWVKKGGTLIVSGSYITPDAVNDFIERLYLRIGEIPLGSAYRNIDSTGNNYVHVPNTAPIMYTDLSKALSVQLATEVLLKNEGYPVVVRMKYEKGNILLIASDRFLTSQVLQDKENPSRVQNVQWLMSLLKGMHNTR